MGRTIQELAGVRDGIRRQWLLPVPGAFPGAPEIEDTSEETLALLAKQRQFSAALLRAIRAGNPDAIDAAIRPPARPAGTGRLMNLIADTSLAGVSSALSFGPIAFPYIIREVVVTALNVSGITVEGHIQVTLHLTAADRTGETAEPPEAVIWPEESAAGARRGALLAVGGSSNTARYTAGKLVTDVGFFLTARLFEVLVGTMTASIGILIEEVAFGSAGLGALYLPDPGRISMNANNRPPVRRLPGPPVPRGAVIRVTQGGRILAERRVPWIALDPSIKAKWFAQQPPVSVDPDPSIEWIQ